jgi:hypothetical protein
VQPITRCIPSFREETLNIDEEVGRVTRLKVVVADAFRWLFLMVWKAERTTSQQ